MLDNAIKFTPENGTVTVELKTHGTGGIQLRVADTGPGIPKAERKRIFKRFYRLDNGLTREAAGAGIGLSIVKHIAEAHGGTIDVRAGEGGGAVFEVVLTGGKP